MNSIPSGFSVENLLLSALSAEVRKELMAHLEPVSLPYSHVIYEIDDSIDYVYFINAGMVSLISTTLEGQSLEVAIVGREGYVGIPVFLESGVSPYRVISQSDTDTLRMKAGAFKDACARHEPLEELLHCYAQSLIKAIAQSALCVCFHPLEARFCRWLLVCQDNTKSYEFYLTQEFIADMLGVRRAGVTVAAGNIQNKGLISYNRGHITILDRKGLEAACCECYRCIKEAFEWLNKS
jgi:CRP-like cAMP-binding protein